jgi:uncharacterized membrane protein (DUF2068 family)
VTQLISKGGILNKHRSAALVAIVSYKLFVASLMIVTSTAAFFTLKNHQSLVQFSESYLLESKLILVDWVLDKILKLDPKTLQFSGLVAALYAGITAVEAMGLWHKKIWAEILVVVLVGISIPFEILELVRGISILKLIVFFINVAVLWYLSRQFLKSMRLH